MCYAGLKKRKGGGTQGGTDWEAVQAGQDNIDFSRGFDSGNRLFYVPDIFGCPWLHVQAGRRGSPRGRGRGAPAALGRDALKVI